MHRDPRAGEMVRIMSASTPLGALGTELLATVLPYMEERHYAAGETLITQGDPGEFLLVLLEGTAWAGARDHVGRVTAVGEFGPGDVVGEMALVTRQTRTADVVARTPVRALSLADGDLQTLMITHPELGVILTNIVAERLGRSAHDGLGGKTLNGYRIVCGLGRGGMGVVYRAERVADGNTVALKMMSHRLLYQPGAVERFKRETRILQSLQHENIVQLHDSFGAYRTQFLVMEFCDGEPLNRLIATHGAFSEDVVRRVLGQLAGALRCVHHLGLIHGDLKPSNVMLSRSGHVKLTDFGLARVADPLTADTVLELGRAGTLGYMAPEQFSRDDVDAQVDIYSLACVAYELLSGRALFRAEDVPSIIRRQAMFELPPAETIARGLSQDLYDLLRRGLQPDPRNRVVSLEHLVTWSGIVDGRVFEEHGAGARDWPGTPGSSDLTISRE